MSYIERIQSNDPELADLRLTEIPEAYTNDLPLFFEALKSNTVIEFVRLDRDFLPGLKPEMVRDLFVAAGSIPNLKEMLIWHASLPMKFLSEFIVLAKGLQHLQLGVLNLEGDQDDFANLAKALEDHPNLDHFELSDFSVAEASISIDPILKALACVPKLKQVKVEVTFQKRGSLVGSVAAAQKVVIDLTGEAVAVLLSSKSLEMLQISRLGLKSEEVKALAAAIPSSPALKSLALTHCKLDDDSCSAIAVGVRDSNTIEKLDLSCNNITDEGCIAIATALTGNKSVKTLRLWGNVKISNTGFDALAEMLDQNTSLERIPLMGGNYKNRIDSKLVKNRSNTNQAA